MECVVVTVVLLLCVVCVYMGMCYMKLLQFDEAEESVSESLRIYTSLYPQGHSIISTSETETERTVLRLMSYFTFSLVEQLLHDVWQLKTGQRY